MNRLPVTPGNPGRGRLGQGDAVRVHPPGRQVAARIGGHRTEAADPERDLLRRLGRRRIVTLRTAAIGWRTRDLQ